VKVFAKYLAIVLLWPSHPTADPDLKQGARGTVIYYDFTQDEVVVAADSRGTNMKNGSYFDTQCKISTFNNQSVFAAAGTGHVDIRRNNGDILVWDAQDLARRSFAKARATTDGNTLLAAKYWAGDAYRIFQSALDDAPTDFMKAIPNPSFGGIVDAVFAGVDSTKLSVFDITVDALPKVGGGHAIVVRIRAIPQVSVTTIGQTAVIQEFEAENTDRARAERGKWERSLGPINQTEDPFRELLAVQLVKWAIQYDLTKTVGGSVHAAVLAPSGIRWLTREDNCKAD
jgi:hypothetical protein